METIDSSAIAGKAKVEEQDWSLVKLDWDRYAEVRTAAKKLEQEELIRETANSNVKVILDYIWSPFDTQFDYTAHDVPVTVLPVTGSVSLKITRYRALDRWVGKVRSHASRQLLEDLSRKLYMYCESMPSDPAPICKVGQICFVKIPTYKEIDEMMELAIGKAAWAARRLPEKRKDEEDRWAGYWARAECNALSSCKRFAQFTSIDTGRKFPACWTNTRRAVYHFLTTPGTAFMCILLLNKPMQITVPIHNKWVNIMKVGSHMTFKILGITPDETLLVRLVKPTEDEIEQRYNEALNGEPDPCKDTNKQLYNPPNSELVRRGTFF